MIEVYSKLFVGDQDDYEYDVSQRSGWAIVQACKEPYHRRALGYLPSKAAPKGSEYYVARRDNRLILNMVDAPRSDFFYKEEMIDEALDFIDQALTNNMNVLVHCNVGESRSPSIALLYMAARLRVLPTESLQAAEAQFKRKYPKYNPKTGIREHLQKYWVQYCDDGKRKTRSGTDL
ncbi:MAG TPA: dual specificity protein phosphatase [Ktedonobacteraceae bacterium]|nr:dual specificity protein phosphatase [Ktedonobacteraceae bacterium]